jgi:hypothetical protein
MADPPPPSYVKPFTFLEVACGKGVNPVMAERLSQAEAAIRATYDALPEEDRVDPATGLGGASFRQWCAIKEPHRAWRPGRSHHSAGAAVDVNYTTNPYIATRSGDVYGGEAAGHQLTGVREAAVAVYDRAVEFTDGPGATADVAARRPGESTQSVWNRFSTVSAALAGYLSLAFHTERTTISRAPIPDVENADTATLDQIPSTELRAPDEALTLITDLTSSDFWLESHPDGAPDPWDLYYRILRDYELVRIPMVIGNPSFSPALTRNPARGFLDIRPEIVVALCDVGMRWGASDFDSGRSNGDIQHFDLADNGGYPPSG